MTHTEMLFGEVEHKSNVTEQTPAPFLAFVSWPQPGSGRDFKLKSGARSDSIIALLPRPDSDSDSWKVKRHKHTLMGLKVKTDEFQTS